MRQGRCYIQGAFSVGPNLANPAVNFEGDKETSSRSGAGGRINSLCKGWDITHPCPCSAHGWSLPLDLPWAVAAPSSSLLAPMGWAPSYPRLSAETVLRKGLFLGALRIFNKRAWKGKPTRAASKGGLAAQSSQPCSPCPPWAWEVASGKVATALRRWWAGNIFHVIKKENNRKTP